MKKGPRRRTVLLAAVAGLILLSVIALVILSVHLRRHGERALSGVFPASPLAFASLRDAAGPWKAIEERGIPDLLKRSRSLYEAEGLPAVEWLVDLHRELEAESGMSIDGDLLMHLAGKGAALGLYRSAQGEAPDWVAVFRTTLPAWAVLRAWFLWNSTGAGAGSGEASVYRGRRLLGIEGGGSDGRIPQLFFVGDALVAASRPAVAEAALDCYEGGEGCFRGRKESLFDTLDQEGSGDLHFMVGPSGLEGIPGVDAPGDPWPRLDKLAASVDIGDKTRAVFAATVENWGSLRPAGPGEREEMEMRRHVGGSTVLLAAVRGAPLPEGIARLTPLGEGGEPGPPEALEWVLAVRDFSEKEFIPFPRAILLVDEGSAAGALEALDNRFPQPAGRGLISGFPASFSAPVHRWGVELLPGGAAFGRYTAFAYDRGLLEEAVSSAGRVKAGEGGGGEQSSVRGPAGDTIFYGSLDNTRLVAALRRVAVPLSSALGDGGGDPPGLAADIDIFSNLRSAVIRVDGAGKKISGEADLNFGTR